MTDTSDLQSLRQAAEQCKPILPSQICALLDRLERAEAALYCPSCKGSGEGVGMEGRGPDAYEVAINCPTCGGTGARSPAGAAVPDTHVVVPKEPTEAMTYAARHALSGDRSGNIAAPIYRAMLAAAPAAPSAPTERPSELANLTRFECVLTPEGKAEMYVSPNGPYVWFDHVVAATAEPAPVAQASQQPVARLLHWNGPKHISVPHGGICARTYAEFPKGAGEGGGYWTEGAPLATAAAPLQQAEGWISVDERLPSPAILTGGVTPIVLAAWKRGVIADNLCQVGTSNTVFLARNKDKFTHWMPIPPLPAQSQPAGPAKGGITNDSESIESDRAIAASKGGDRCG